MGIYVPCTKCSTHVRGQEQASRLTFATQVHLDQPLANVLLKKSVTPGNELIPCSLFFDHSSLPSTIPVPDKVVEFPKPKKKSSSLGVKSPQKLQGPPRTWEWYGSRLSERAPMTLGVLEKALTKEWANKSLKFHPKMCLKPAVAP